MSDLDGAILQLNQQHAALQVALHQMHRALRAGEVRIVLRSAMNDLEQTFLTHFSMEEELMSRLGYAGLARHKGEHLQFILDYFILLQLDFRQEGFLDIEAMKAWFLEHLEQQDAPFEAFLEQHARQERPLQDALTLTASV